MLPDLTVGLDHHALHGALVVFVGAVNIEEFQADHLAVQFLPQQPEVEELLGVAVHVQRREAGDQGRIVAEPQTAVAVSGRGAGVDEARALVQGVAAEIAAVVEIVFHQKVRVALGGGGTGPQMDHGRDLPGQGVSLHQLVKAVAVQIVHIAAFDQIAPFLAAGQIVHHHDFVQIHAVQLPEQGAADKARAAGDHVHKSLRAPC